jgi:hypothetical protein
MDKPLSLPLQKALHGDACSARYDAGNIVRRYALTEHRPLAVTRRGDLTLEPGDRSVTQTGRSLVVALALRDLQLMLGLLEAAFPFLVALESLTFCPYIE